MIAKLVTLCVLFVMSNNLTVNFVVGESNGLTIKLIHDDSLESPFYQPNLTYTQRIERMVNQSKGRLNYLSNFPTNLRSKIKVENHIVYSAEIGLGSFKTREPFKSYYFHVDVGSSLTWVECQDCKLPGNHCFRQVGEPFPDHSSSSHKRLLCNPTQGQRHPLCNPRKCIGEYCAFQFTYLDNCSTTGYLAQETFTFDAITRGQKKERVCDLVFGCAFDIKNNILSKLNTIAGTLGLGRGPESFVTQLGSRSNGKFSYCFQRSIIKPPTTYLQFGDSIPTSRAIYKTPLKQYRNQDSYFVHLLGITAAGKRLKVSANVFARNPNGTGGCILDTGAGLTHIVNVAYEKLIEILTEYFDRNRSFRRIQRPDLDFCYKRLGTKQGFKNLPTIVFHFEGADFKLDPGSIFYIGKLNKNEFFCLAMLPNKGPDHFTIIGAYQQTDYRFVYYTRDNMLHFGPENCI